MWGTLRNGLTWPYISQCKANLMRKAEDEGRTRHEGKWRRKRKMRRSHFNGHPRIIFLMHVDKGCRPCKRGGPDREHMRNVTATKPTCNQILACRNLRRLPESVPTALADSAYRHGRCDLYSRGNKVDPMTTSWAVTTVLTLHQMIIEVIIRSSIVVPITNISRPWIRHLTTF